MKPRKTQLAAVAIVACALLFGVSVFRDGTTPAYAVDQTMAAIEEIETVYMAGEFYRQGEFECWMRFDGDPDRPTHVWLGRAGWPNCKICSPDGIFGLNKRTNRIHLVTRDERSMDWIPRFGYLFEDMVTKAGQDDAIEFSTQSSAGGEKAILVRVTTSQRVQEFVVDAKSKLPRRFTTVREDAPQEMMRKTLAVRHLTEIRYNETPPAGIFAKPSDAIVVEHEVDCWVDPNSGLSVGNRARDEACRELVRQACQALVDLDEAKLKSLALFFRLWPPQVWEQARKMKDAGRWVQGYEITGEPYQEGDVWFVPTELKSADGKTESQTVMIKFYDFDGTVRAFSIGSKEKGVVD